MTTVSDIAKQTGLAVTSVAKILRNRPGFNEKTRQRVLKVAREMGYRPNYLSRALAGGRSMTVGLIFSGQMVPISEYRLRGMEQACRAGQYMPYTAIVSGNTNDPDSRQTLADLLQRRVDGLLIDHNRFFRDVLLEEMCKSPIPYVWIGPSYPADLPARVSVVREGGYRQAAEHLHELGHRRVAMLTTTTDWHDPDFKMNPARRAFQAVGVELLTDRTWMLDPTLADGQRSYAAARRVLETRPDLTAILANNDLGALAAMRLIHERGGQVPRDMSIVGFDDLPFTQFLTPSLTSIHQPRDESGRMAFQILQSMIERPDFTPQPIELSCSLSVRESTGPVRSETTFQGKTP